MNEASLASTSPHAGLAALIERAGEPASRRFLEFFTVHTQSYLRALGASNSKP
jgi:hypothetical protein